MNALTYLALGNLAEHIANVEHLPEELKIHFVTILQKIASEERPDKDLKKTIVILSDVFWTEEKLENTEAVSCAIECQGQSEWNDDQIAVIQL